MAVRWEYRYTVLVLCTLAFFATMVGRLAISPVVPAIADTFGNSTGAIGLALTGMWAAYALMQFPSGILADRFGERRVILAAVALTGLSSLALAAAPSMLAFGVLAVVLGAGAGLHYTVATTLLTRLFANTGRAIGAHVTGGPLSGLLAPIAAAAIGSRYGWRPALLLGAAAAIPVGLLFVRAVRPTTPRRPDQPMRERFEPGPIAALLSRPQIAYTTVLAVTTAFVWQATASFLPALLATHHGLSIGTAGALFSAYFVIQGTLVPAVGWVSDRFGRDPALVATLGTGIVAYGLLAIGGSFPSIVAGVVLAGVAMSWSAPLQDRFIVALSEEERNVGFGLVRTVYMLLGALGSVVTGALADVAGWGVAYGNLTAILAISTASIVAVRAFGIDV